MTTAADSHPENGAGLTAREREVAELISLGASNKEIADRLGITERTVKAHLTSVFQKLHLSSRLQLAVRMLSASSTNVR
jgi:DNA-binding NarL/FixJ family response regulator